MSSKTALVLETNPVITERYLEYTNDSTWRLMIKDSLNDFLEKLQKDDFDLVVAEESILPQGIIGMLRSVGVPFILSSNTKNPEVKTIPRNFSRTELLTVFNTLAPDSKKELPSEENENEATEVNELFSDLEDEEETFELTSDAVILEPGKQPAEKDDAAALADDLFGEDTDGGKNGISAGQLHDDEEDLAGEVTLKQALETDDDAAVDLFADIPDNEEETSGNILENTAAAEEETPKETQSAAEDEPVSEPEEAASGAVSPLDDAVRAEISAWLEKNARSIIKEIVLEQLASLSGKNND